MKKLSQILSVLTIITVVVVITFSCKKDKGWERQYNCSIDELSGSYVGQGTYKDYQDTANIIESVIDSVSIDITPLTASSVSVLVETSDNFSKTFSGSFYDTYNFNFYSHPYKLNFSVWKNSDDNLCLKGYVGKYLSDTSEMVRTISFEIEKIE